MNPERPKVDRAVLDFVKGHVFDATDFVIPLRWRLQGSIREMTRMVVAKCFDIKSQRPDWPESVESKCGAVTLG